ncbi:UDP-N-acetylglucosamine 1-carboxyvinyltransferase, partial [Metabacillus halosaccharovorans]
RSMGVEISGAGTNEIIIEGQSHLNNGYIEVMPDRLQIGTYIIASLMTDGELVMDQKYLEHLDILCKKLSQAGAQFNYLDNGSVVISGKRPYKSISFETVPYPGFPTDLQAPMMAFLTCCEGKNYVKENIFENRLLHVSELKKMGAKIIVLSEREVEIHGGTELNASNNLEPMDIRGGAAILLCSLSLNKGNESLISNLHHIERGYPNYIQILRNLGAKITQKVLVQ